MSKIEPIKERSLAFDPVSEAGAHLEVLYHRRDSPILPNTSQTSTHRLGFRPDNIAQLKGKEITWAAYADNAAVKEGRLDLSDRYEELSKYYSKA